MHISILKCEEASQGGNRVMLNTKQMRHWYCSSPTPVEESFYSYMFYFLKAELTDISDITDRTDNEDLIQLHRGEMCEFINLI